MSESFNDRIARLAKEKREKAIDEVGNKSPIDSTTEKIITDSTSLEAYKDGYLSLIKKKESEGFTTISLDTIKEELLVTDTIAIALMTEYSTGKMSKEDSSIMRSTTSIPDDFEYMITPDTDYKDKSEPLANRILSYAHEKDMEKFPVDLAISLFSATQDDVLDAFYDLAKAGWSGDPKGPVYPIYMKRRNMNILGENDYHPSDTHPVDVNGKTMSMTEVLNQAERREVDGMYKIATGLVPARDAMMAHDIMDTENQIKAFQVQLVRKELLRIIKLSDTLAKIEDKYMDTALRYIDKMDLETMEATMRVIGLSLKRSTDVLDKYTKDEELKIFIQETSNEAQIALANTQLSEDGVATHATGLVKNKDSREKIRNIATKFLQLMDNPESIKSAGGESVES